VDDHPEEVFELPVVAGREGVRTQIGTARMNRALYDLLTKNGKPLQYSGKYLTAMVGGKRLL
jgi:hypothetical protein